MTVRYIGIRLETGCKVMRVSEQGKCTLLKKSSRSRRYPSSAWEWGYNGTGPAELAWALAYDVTSDRSIVDGVYQPLKWQVIAHLPKYHWILTTAEILGAIDRIGTAALAQGDDTIDLGLTNPVPAAEPRKPDVFHDTHTHP